MIMLSILFVASLSQMLTCNNPVHGNVFRTVRLSQHSGSTSDPLFVPGRTYYFFGMYIISLWSFVIHAKSSSGIFVNERREPIQEEENKLEQELEVAAN